MNDVPVTQLNWQMAPRYDEKGCPFCDIVRGRAPAEVVHVWPESMAIIPRKPVTPGHILVIPNAHVRDFTEDPAVSATISQRVVEIAHAMISTAEAVKEEQGVNVITSIGNLASQSVFHLHIHIVPRREDDGLKLPWS
jgi:histidine triad (HIT) family protein